MALQQAVEGETTHMSCGTQSRYENRCPSQLTVKFSLFIIVKFRKDQECFLFLVSSK
jgi:hypothetical protein